MYCMKIYLIGSVPKGDKEEAEFYNWRADYEKILNKLFTDAEYVDPYKRDLDENDFFLIFGFDCKHIIESNLLILNAETRVGVGSAQEMIIAKYFKIPVVTVLPKDTHHRRSNVMFRGHNIKDWIHPFIFSFSDFIIEDIRDFEKIKDKVFSKPPKDISVIDDSMDYFESKQ